MANSVNTISVKLCMDEGVKNVLELAHQLGIDEALPEVPSIALGIADISLKQMVGAYSVFANQGTYVSPYFIAKVYDRKEKVIYENKVENKEVLSTEVSVDITNMLKGVVNYGTASRLRSQYKY